MLKLGQADISRVEEKHEDQLLRDLRRQILDLEEKVSRLGEKNTQLIKKMMDKQSFDTDLTLDQTSSNSQLEKRLRTENMIYKSRLEEAKGDLKMRWTNKSVFGVCVIAMVLAFINRPFVYTC